MRAPDPGDRPLVAEERVELPPLALEDLGERGRVDVERVRPEVREVGLDLLGRGEPDARALLPPALGEQELAASAEAKPEHRRLRPLRPGLEVADAACAHQVDAEDELAVLGREEEVLRAPLGALEAAALERRERRVDRLQRRDVSRPRALDRLGGHERVELAHPGLDLG